MSELYEVDPLMIEQSIESWVITKCDDWRDHYESNYSYRFEEYSGFGAASGILLTVQGLQSVQGSYPLPYNRP